MTAVMMLNETAEGEYVKVVRVLPAAIRSTFRQYGKKVVHLIHNITVGHIKQTKTPYKTKTRFKTNNWKSVRHEMASKAGRQCSSHSIFTPRLLSHHRVIRDHSEWFPGWLPRSGGPANPIAASASFAINPISRWRTVPSWRREYEEIDFLSV